MKSKIVFAALIALPLLFLACIPQTDTQDTNSPISENPPSITSTPTDIPSLTATQTLAPSPTPTPSPSHTVTPASLQTSPWHWLQMFDLTTGWAVDAEGAVFRITADSDGWQEVTPQQSIVTPQVLSAFLDPQTAWLLYHGDPIPFTGPWEVWRTVDGGQNWTVVGQLSAAQERLQMVQIIFIDANHGWVLGQVYPGMNQVFAFLYATVDGGATWQIVSDPSPPSGPSPMDLPGSYSLPFGQQPLTFISPQVGFTGGDSLYKTQDGGQTWSPQIVPGPSDLPVLEQSFTYISPPHFFTAEDGIFQNLVFDFATVFCPPCDVFSAPPAARYVYVTQDGGQTWVPQLAPGPFGMAGLLDADTAWFLGQEQPSQPGTTLYLSQDQGATWTVQAENTLLPVGTRLYFITDDTGLAYNPFVGGGFSMYQISALVDMAGEDPYFYVTQDAGATWSPFPPAYP